MRIKRHSRSIVCGFMACVVGSLLFSTSEQAAADVTYEVTGYANNLGPDDGTLSPQVGLSEAFTAVFEIDDSTADSNPASDNGLFLGAITSSSIDFAGGYSSTVDFTGGNVQIAQANPGGGVFLTAPGGNGSILLFAQAPFASDSLLTMDQSISTQFGTLWSLTEGDGLVVGGTPFPGLPTIGNGPFVLAVTAAAVPEPSSMAVLGLGLVFASVRRRRS